MRTQAYRYFQRNYDFFILVGPERVNLIKVRESKYDFS